VLIITQPFIIANQAISFASVPYGMGRHIYYLKPSDIMNAMRYNAIAQIFNIVGFYFVKGSIVLFSVRLITRVHKQKRMILWASFGVLTLANLEATIVALFKCQPLQKEWNPAIPGKCWDKNIFHYSTYALAGMFTYPNHGTTGY
jgi:hypothetical protein